MTRVNTRQRALYSLLLISTLGILLQPALAFTCNTYELRDLEACDPEDFKEEAREWSASKLIYKKVITSECDGELLLGGYNVLGDESSSSGEYFYRTYKNLDIARHNMIYFTASFSLIDGWDAEDGISIFINEEKLDLQFYQKDFPCNKCGGPGNDLTDVYVVAKVPHNEKYVNIKIVSDSKKPCDTASFGFRDISILFVNVDPKDLECSVCALADVPLTKDECPCPKGTFLSETKGSLTSWAHKKCLPSSPKCVYGFGPTASDCYECSKGTFFDGECCTDCHPKCEECTGAGPDQCTKEKFKPCYKGFYLWIESETDDKCVRDCPEGWKCDKDRYGHDVCVPQCDLKCEENTWFEEILQCVCDCPSGWKTEIVNKVPTCVKVCRKHEFWWEEGCEGGACVEKCPEGWECAEDRLTGLDFCQRKCCDEEKDILFQGECVCKCPDGWEVEKVNGVNVCSHACECGQYWWKEGSECGACVDKCPEGWKCDKGCEDVDICVPRCCAEDKENIWFQEKGECVCECPDGWETEMVNDVPVCAKSCDKGEFWWKGEGDCGSCVCECPNGWKCDQGCEGVDICTPECCPEDEENIWFQEYKQCVCECPEGWKTEKVNDVLICAHACECGQFWWDDGDCGACVCECPEGWKCDKGPAGVDICVPQCCDDADENIWFQEKGECVCECPEGWRTEKMNEVDVCVKVCEKGQFFWQDGGKDGACVCECPAGWKCDQGCEGVDICTPQCCPEDEENIWFQETKQCLCECPEGWKAEKVNDVYICAHACECGQFWWEEGDNKCGSCVSKCPDGWKCDKGCEGVDICVPQCCDDADENIWFQEKGECVCECPEGWKKEKLNDVDACVPSCECGQFFWQEGGDCGACVDKCPEGWKCDKGCEGIDICTPQCDRYTDEKIWFEAKGQCVCECPDGWEKEKVNDVLTCERACKEGQFWWEEGGKEGSCVCECPDGWKCDKGCEGVDICTPQCCAEEDENIWFQEKKECVCDCPPGWRKEKVNDVPACVRSCECGQYWWQEEGECGACVDKCPDGWKCDKGCEGVDICTPQCCAEDKENIWFEEKGECVCECPEGWRSEKVNDVKMCVKSCECGQFFWQDGGECGACIDKCPDGWKCDQGCEGVDICTPQCCPEDEENIWFQETKQCLCECPEGWKAEKVNDVYICAHACECGQFWWEEGDNNCGSCVSKCPDGWKCDKGCEGVDICTPQCCADSDENIWFQEKGECVCQCPDGWEKQKVNDVDVCMKTCNDCQFWWKEGSECGACVDKCPEGWKCDKGCEGVDICTPQCCPEDKENIWFQEKGECVCECPSGWEKENVNEVPVCVKSCECGQFFWQEGGDCGACVEKCPDGWKCDKGCEGVDICSPQCCADDKENIWFEEKGECVCECPEGWRSDKVNDVKMCVKSCECGQFFWQDGGECGACVDKCPEGWKCDKGCEGVDICTPQCCAEDKENIWFQEKGECVCECPEGWRTEKLNDVPVCVQVCDKGESFWEKGGKDGACVCDCPVGWRSDKGCEGVDICVPNCDCNNEEKIWFEEEKDCVCNCPPGWEKEKINAVDVCRKGCYHGQFFWQEGGKYGLCVDNCPKGWHCGKDKFGLDICKPHCDENSKEKIWFQDKDKCVYKCPDGFEVEFVNKVPACVPCDK